MTIFTSNFASTRKFRRKDVFFVSISLFSPSFFCGESLAFFAPEKELLREYKAGRLSNDDYIRKYTSETLDRLDPQIVDEALAKLVKAHEGHIPVLLCYEKTEDFCHRHLVSAFLRDFGHLCTEAVGAAFLGQEKEAEPEIPQQLSLL